MPEFNPDSYLAKKSGDLFDPDKYLAKAPEKNQKPARFSEVESGLLGASQGATFGFGDEAAGGLVAAVDKLRGKPESYGQLYEKRRDEQRSILNEAQAENPKSFLAGEIGGSLATTAVIPGAGIAKGAKFLPSVAKSAGLGAVASAGLSENDPTKSLESLQDFGVDVAKGAAIGGAAQGALSGAGKVVSAVTPESLKEFARQKALTAAGFMTKDLKKLAPSQQEKIGRELLDGKVVTAFSSLNKIVERAGEGKEAAGKMIGQIGEQIDAKVPNAINLSNVADELDKYAASIPKTVAGKNLANRVTEEADNFRTMGATGFKQAQDLKNQFQYKFGNSDSLISNQDVTNKVRQVINKEMENTVENLSKQPEVNFSLTDYVAAKNKYGALKNAEQTAQSRAGSVAANRSFGLTDTIAGVGGLSYGGPVTGVALGGLNKIARKYGASVQAVAADKLADGITAAVSKSPDLLKRVSPMIEKAARQGNKAVVAVHLSLMNDPEYASAFNEDEPKQLNAFERRLQNKPQP